MNRIPYARFPAGSNHKSCSLLPPPVSPPFSRPVGHPYFLHGETRDLLVRTPSRGATNKVPTWDICTRTVGYLVFASASYLNICPTCFARAFTVRFYHLACLRAAPLKMHVNVASMSLDVCSISPRSDTFKTRTIFVSKASAY